MSLPDYASLCVLSYNRPQFLYTCIKSIHETAGYPFELIVHDDGTAEQGIGGLFEHMLTEGVISSIIRNPPNQNEGVGVSMERMFHLASGDPIIKIDQDLVFDKKGWLAETVEILRRSTREFNEGARVRPIAALGAFHYDAEPVERTAMHVADHGYFEEVKDFVGSFIAVPRWVYQTQGPFQTRSAAFAEDVAFKTQCQEHHMVLGLPPEDFAYNVGFGPGPSTVVFNDDDGKIGVSKIKQGPVVFDGV